MAKKENPAAPEPRKGVRLLAEQFWTLVVLAAVIGMVGALIIGESLPPVERGAAKGIMLLVVLAVVIGAALLVKVVLGAEFEEAVRRRRAIRESKMLSREARRITRKR